MGKGQIPKYVVAGLLFSLLVLGIGLETSSAQPIPKVTLGVEEAKGPGDVVVTLEIILLLTVLSLAPALLIMLTSFTRIIVILSFLRHALSTHQMPPNQLLIGLALFLTFFIMAPVWKQVNDQALQPYLRGEISQKMAYQKGMQPIREFMMKQTREKDVALFVSIARMEKPNDPSELPNHVLIPSFIISELKTAFQIGFALYVPFLIIDIVVASVLMSMGMLMLPPIMISLPFKILLFVLVDGWQLIVRSTMLSFY